MSDSSRSFWSSIPGLITGLAGLITGIVGLLSLAFQQGWVGGKSSSTNDTTTTTVSTVPGQLTTTLPGQTGSFGSLGSSTTALGSFDVQPNPIDFKSSREVTVTVRNTGPAPLVMSPPQLSDTSAFSTTDVSCASATLDRGGTCQLKVTFKPSGVLRSYSATLTLSARGGGPSVAVPISASSLLG
jgi:hypothetical protein